MAALDLYLTENAEFFRRSDSSIALSDGSPSWMPLFRRRIEELRLLKKGWDGASAKRVSHHVAAYVLSLVEGLGCIKQPQVVPLVNGGLQLEWHSNGVSVEVSVPKPHFAELYIQYHQDGEEIERELLDNDDDLDTALAIISE